MTRRQCSSIALMTAKKALTAILLCEVVPQAAAQEAAHIPSMSVHQMVLQGEISNVLQEYVPAEEIVQLDCLDHSLKALITLLL